MSSEGNKPMGRKLFCELGPRCYKISVEKEILRRRLKDAFSGETLARTHDLTPLPQIVKGHSSILIRHLNGVDLQLQQNKVTNLRLAAEKINGLLIRPGETFSFWQTIGRPTAKKGYLDGLLIGKNSLHAGVGGGLCQMGNLIHYLVLNSPLTVTELHHHSDALFPDERRRVPFGTGTSVFYSNVDYRFKNTTDQTVQLLVWVDKEDLCGELRSERPFPCRYKLVEENHHFRKEGDKYYRISQVYRLVIDKETQTQIGKELVLDNHSAVMYDYSLIPKEQIRDDAATVSSV